ncbi:hypothetical protein CPB83DRAFT_579287 [Crepidotus variabilis]|uniref:Uncharacterized protein n=1 Tax=Crepidotus variabilis TaxID=179855 RepID=A0A9P6E9B7_9AGAR|nr:hypothetical protein CPB83DRAFT_579287 [Crepidotus variabilis]
MTFRPLCSIFFVHLQTLLSPLFTPFRPEDWSSIYPITFRIIFPSQLNLPPPSLSPQLKTNFHRSLPPSTEAYAHVIPFGSGTFFFTLLYFRLFLSKPTFAVLYPPSTRSRTCPQYTLLRFGFAPLPNFFLSLRFTNRTWHPLLHNAQVTNHFFKLDQKHKNISISFTFATNFCRSFPLRPRPALTLYNSAPLSFVFSSFSPLQNQLLSFFTPFERGLCSRYHFNDSLPFLLYYYPHSYPHYYYPYTSAPYFQLAHIPFRHCLHSAHKS